MSIGNIFKSLGHGIAWFAKHTVSFAQKSEAEVAVIQQAVPEIKAIIGIVSPQAANLLDLASHVLGAYGEAASAVDSAISANGVNVKLDQDVHDKIMAFVASIKDNVNAGLKK